MGTTQNYDSNEVSVSFAGRSIDAGRADGEFVTITFASEIFTKKVGADGEVTRSKTNDFSGSCTLKLLATSSGHQTLTALYATARASATGEDMAPLQIRDRNTGLEYHAEKAWIAKHGDVGFGKEVGEREWVIDFGDLVPQVGAL